MYFIVGKTINQNKQIISYLITDGDSVKEVAPQQVYVEYQKGNLTYLKGFNDKTGEADFKNIDNSLIPTFYNGRGISNSVSVLKIIEENNKQIGVRVIETSGKIINMSLSDIIKLVNSKKIQLFNAKIVNNKIVMKYAGTVVTETSRGNKKEVTINNYDKSKFIIENLRLIKYEGNDKEVIIPKGVTSIGNEAFYGCENLTSIIIPNSVTSIGADAFWWCTSLTSVTIPDSVTSIETGAFYCCTRLKNIAIPDSVINIGINAFFRTEWYESQPNGLVYAGKVAYKYKGDMPEYASIVLKGGTKGIGQNAFHYIKNLTNITIPDSVINIGASAFSRCTGLTSIKIPNSVKRIRDCAFFKCTNLKSINIPDSVTRIESCVFDRCTSLKSITIPGSVTIIEAGAFAECPSLTSINIPNSVTSIEDNAFAECTSLTSINIPSSVTNIGDNVFGDCPNICIIGVRGSVAEKYAMNNNIKFEVIT